MDNRSTNEENKMNEGDLVAELLQITAELGGRMERLDTYDSKGTIGKKIIIEYNVTEKK